MAKRQQQEESEHYEECPQHSDPAAPNCHCEGINQAEENYRTEPDDMFAREWGNY